MSISSVEKKMFVIFSLKKLDIACFNKYVKVSSNQSSITKVVHTTCALYSKSSEFIQWLCVRNKVYFESLRNDNFLMNSSFKLDFPAGVRSGWILLCPVTEEIVDKHEPWTKWPFPVSPSTHTNPHTDISSCAQTCRLSCVATISVIRQTTERSCFDPWILNLINVSDNVWLMSDKEFFSFWQKH